LFGSVFVAIDYKNSIIKNIFSNGENLSSEPVINIWLLVIVGTFLQDYFVL